MSRIQLFHHPYTRAITARWYVKELGMEEEVDIVEVDYTAKAHKAPDFMQISPFGRLPALRHGDLDLFESGAILTYLAECKGDPRLATAQGRAINDAWVLASNSTISDALWHGSDSAMKGPSAATVLSELDAVLSQREYLLGDAPFLSAADASMASLLVYSGAMLPGETLDRAKYPHLLAWMDRITSRPACKEVYGDLLGMWEGKKAEAAAKADDAKGDADGARAEEEHASKKAKA